MMAALCGQILVVGVAGVTLAPDEASALSRGERGGVVLFRRNVGRDAAGCAEVAELTQAVRGARPDALIAIDQEGGRVVRIGPPAFGLPPMRKIGELDDVAFTERLAVAQARELSALGITMSFAPVADIHTRADNPIIGDRAFAESPEKVATFARAWARGLARGGVLSCAKHFPGHGDTTVDSHLALPRVERDAAGLEAVEIAAFRSLARDVDAMMSAHVVYPALDERPATLSRTICTDLLRTKLGFDGVLFCDDLEMKAIQLPVGEAAVLAVGAGCDAILVCSRADLAEEAYVALVHECEKSEAFRVRIAEAHERVMKMRHRFPSIAVAPAALAGIFAASTAIAGELAARLGGLSA